MLLAPVTAATGNILILIWCAVGLVWLWNGIMHERRQQKKHAIEMLHMQQMATMDLIALQAMQRRADRAPQQH